LKGKKAARSGTKTKEKGSKESILQRDVLALHCEGWGGKGKATQNRGDKTPPEK